MPGIELGEFFSEAAAQFGDSMAEGDPDATDNLHVSDNRWLGELFPHGRLPIYQGKLVVPTGDNRDLPANPGGTGSDENGEDAFRD